MKVIGLTGSIGMGKTTVAKILKGFGFLVHSADVVVQKEYEPGGAAHAFVAKGWPNMLNDGRVDRVAWSDFVFSHPSILDKLEKILHPIVENSERAFLRDARKQKANVAVLEIPLLFETRAKTRCDIILCVTAPFDAQKARVLSRPYMNETKFNCALARQLSDAEKCDKADYTIPTGISLEETEICLRLLLTKLGLLDKKSLPCRNASQTSRSVSCSRK